MKNKFNYICIFICLGCLFKPITSYNNYYKHINNKDPKLKKIALKMLKKYNSDGYQIITKYEKTPKRFRFANGTSISISHRGNFTMYLRHNNYIINTSSLATAVHEMCHAYTSLAGYNYIQKNQLQLDGTYYGYYTNGNTIPVKITETFPSMKIKKIIPNKLRTFRFKTYIYPSSQYNSTQKRGVYGLLDELNAYYHGTKTSYKLKNYYKNKLPQNAQNWTKYFQGINGTYYAYLEFKYYIFKYLEYAQKYHKEIYQKITSNNNFIKAFLSIIHNWDILINRYFQEKIIIYKYLKNIGLIVNEKKSTLWINKKNSYRKYGRGNFLPVYNLLNNELSKNSYKKIILNLKNKLKSNLKIKKNLKVKQNNNNDYHNNKDEFEREEDNFDSYEY